MRIDGLIVEGKALSGLSNKTELKNKYDIWCSKVRMFMKEGDFTEKERDEIKVKMYYTENEYSENDTVMSIRNSLRDTLCFLVERSVVSERELPKEIGLMLIERVLNNFYMYYRAMYKNSTHKKGMLTQEALNSIQIGNEYDLQRMLYSLLLPIFPTIRQEVESDNGYRGMRADIYLEDYNLIIETKCTRDSLNEKRLTEKLGADGFHYKADVIYFFVYDKGMVVKNIEAFKKAFERTQEKDGKSVKMFILQPMEF